MFTVNAETLTAEVISAEQAGIKNPADLKKVLSIPQMKALAVKFIGKDFEKGTNKDAAAIELFKAIAANLGYSPEEIEAGVAYTYPVAEKPVKEKKVKAPKEPGTRAPSGKNFKLAIGTKPVALEGQKINWNQHTDTLAAAVVGFVEAGKEVASRDEICAKAVEMGLFETKPSNQDVGAIFSWWRKALIEAGYITPVVAEKPAEPEAPVAEVAPQA